MRRTRLTPAGKRQLLQDHLENLSSVSTPTRNTKAYKKLAPYIAKGHIRKELLEDEKCRRYLAPFVRRVFAAVDPDATYKHNWHIDYICEHLEAVKIGQIRRLIINIPPRFLKSIITSVSWPAWILGHNPSEQIIVGSYSERLGTKHSMDCRFILQQCDWYHRMFPDVILAADQAQKQEFQTTKRGHRITVSVGGTATGKGCNILIVDDPHNPKKALSDKEREFACDVWYDQTLSNRFNDPKSAREVVIMQRLHMKDLTGHLLARIGASSRWEHIIIPQEEVVPTREYVFPRTGRVVTRTKGERIHEERYGEEEAAEDKKVKYTWAGQHQQRPSPRGGGRIKTSWFPRFTAQPAQPEECVISIDTGNKKGTLNNPSVMLCFQRQENRWLLIHILKDRLIYPELKRAVMALNDSLHPDTVLIEDKASGTSLIQDLQESTTIPVVPVEPEADKLTRMETQISSLSAGRIMLPDPEYIQGCGRWLLDFEANIENYPQPLEWDEIDALSQFLKWLRIREGGIEDDTYLKVLPGSFTTPSKWTNT